MTTIIGLTGGIAMGKSTISSFLRDQGLTIVDADKIAHNVLEHPQVIEKLVKTFGKDILVGQKINRRKLGSLVFNDKEHLNRLNQIVQPIIRQEILADFKRHESQKVIILDAPVLFEYNYEDIVDYIMVVYTDREKQLIRLQERDNLSKADAEKRVAAQMDIDLKKKRANIVIDTSGTMKETQKQVLDWLSKQKLM